MIEYITWGLVAITWVLIIIKLFRIFGDRNDKK